MRLRSIIIIAAVVATGLPATAVQASPFWTMTTQGIITSGIDYTGVFGVAHRDLAGLAFTQTFIADVDRTKYHGGFQNATENDIFGNTETPAFTLIDSVDGHTVSYAITRPLTQEHYLAAAALLGGTDQVYTTGGGYDAANENFVGAFAYAYTSSAADSFVPAPDFGQSFTAYINFNTTTLNRFSVTGSRGIANFNGDVQVVRVVASDSAPVPEPASIGLLGAGLLGLAALGRRRTS